MISFADLKKYKFTHLSAFPALHSYPAWRLLATSPAVVASQTDVGAEDFIVHMTGQESASLVDAIQTWRYREDSRQHGFFIAKKVPNTNFDLTETNDRQDTGSITPGTPEASIGYKWAIGSLRDYEKNFFEGISAEQRYICFTDPSTYPTHPGWMLRNLLVMVSYRWKLKKIQILCYRDIHARREEARSIILRLEQESFDSKTNATPAPQADPLALPKVTGWERNSAGKVVSKVASLGEFMDPRRLADQAVDLNLQLIKWRIAPTLDLDKIKGTRCLLLGAGTLGSYVARNLLGWGVRKITFVDSGSVSFSNPVRQPLFNFEDCVGGGVRKATRAANALKEIYPGVDSTGYDISVPMAGHPIMNETSVKDDFKVLSRLVEEHDAIFLLMDTRESRWLPTVMGKAAGKIVMNAALGFDSFVVMRHGATNSEDPAQELGCYFCNDIVAPADVSVTWPSSKVMIMTKNSYSPSRIERLTNNAL